MKLTDYDKMLLTVDLFKALGDPVRMKIIRILASQSEKRISVNELVEKFNVSQPAISQHLKILKNIKLLQTEKIGYYIYYSINMKSLINFKKLVDNIFEIALKKCDKFPDCENCKETSNCK